MNNEHVHGILKITGPEWQSATLRFMFFRPFSAHRIANSGKENTVRSSMHFVMMLHTGMRENKMAICAWAHSYVQYLFFSKDIKVVFISELFLFPFIQIGFSRTKGLWSPLILIFHTEIHFTELEAMELEPSTSFSVTRISKCNADWKLKARDMITVLIT